MFYPYPGPEKAILFQDPFYLEKSGVTFTCFPASEIALSVPDALLGTGGLWSRRDPAKASVFLSEA